MQGNTWAARQAERPTKRHDLPLRVVVQSRLITAPIKANRT